MQIDAATVRTIIDLSRAFRASLPPEPEGLERVTSERLAAYATNPLRRRLIAAIDALPVDERQELVALAWIGRDGEPGEDFAAVVRTAYGVAREGAAGYLAAKGPLADYLKDGLAAVGHV